jgi:chemotaxis protein methyltransferase CheR
MSVASAVAKSDEASVDRLAPKNFRRLSEFIHDYSGIKMPLAKQTMLEGRLRRRLRATRCETFDAYCDYLFNGDGLETEAVYLIDVVTTNKTDFFREPKHFDYLRDVALPSLLNDGITGIRAWSAACSIGAEPYSMAMVLADFADSFGPLSYFVLATDLSTDVLRTAHKGIYSSDMVRPVPATLRNRYIRRSRVPGEHHVRVVPELRSHVGFARLNFMDESYAIGQPAHVIFCRNVLIYFEKSTQAKVLSRLCDCLAPGGFLFIGHSESITGFNLPLTTVSNTIFQRNRASSNR